VLLGLSNIRLAGLRLIVKSGVGGTGVLVGTIVGGIDVEVAVGGKGVLVGVAVPDIGMVKVS
jgi:hypothetical protein